jgi:hypothetical protein
MQFIRKTFFGKVLVVLCAILILQSTLLPNYLYALTSGPHMPEYTSYESPGAADMVNLSTGNFSFSLPILDVPGPEGGFSLPLSYHAGIGLEQQASWVGLGWTINPGAITRNIVGFPDDASGEIQNVTVQDLVGLYGWEVNTLGIGKYGWNNEVGHYGSLSILGIINAGWGNGDWYGGVIGLNMSNKGFYVDPVQFAVGIVTIATWGAGAATGKEFFQQAVKGAATGFAFDVGFGAIGALASSMNSVNAPTDGYWKYSKREKVRYVGGLTFKKEYKIWLDKTRYEQMYGILYLGNAQTVAYSNSSILPGKLHANILLTTGGGTSQTLNQFTQTAGNINQGAASDISYDPGNSTESFQVVNNPVFLATDNFSVKAGGISGTISPYRLETGSVSMPREMTSNHIRLAPVKYLSNDPVVPGSYKVPFVYKGQLSSNYFHHVGAQTSITTPQFYYGITKTVSPAPDPFVPASTPSTLTMDINDYTLTNQRIRNDIGATKKVTQTNNIDWLTNDEIRNGITYSSKFLDFLDGGSTVNSNSDRHKFRTKPSGYNTTFTGHTSSFDYAFIPLTYGDISSLNVPNTKINLTVTYYNGETEYSNGQVMNIVDLKDVSVSSVDVPNKMIAITPSGSEIYQCMGKVADVQVQLVSNENTPTGYGGPNTLGGFSVTGADGSTYHFALPIYDHSYESEVREIANPATKRSLIKRSEPFANTWVVTAITGSDYIDVNSNGIADEADWGYWVKFNYGIHSNSYTWRSPFSGYNKELNGTHESYQQGKKQQVYLNSIETRSHVALFLKSMRSDGASFSDAYTTSVYPLKLDEIVLLSRANYEKLIGTYGVAPLSNKINTICQSAQFVNATRTFINLNCEKRILFTYDYSLCPGTPNSIASGKLTLTRVSIKGRNDINLVPDYKFEYGNNQYYSANSWDGWGHYSGNGNSSPQSHQTDQTNPNSGTEWALTKITNPLGSETLINYERDRYSSVSGNGLLTSLNYAMGGAYGSTSNTSVTLTNNGTFQVGDQVTISGSATYQCNGSGYASQSYSGSYTVTAATSNSISLSGSYLTLQNCGVPVYYETHSGTVSKVYNKLGGDIRVSSVVMSDVFGGQNKITYTYLKEDGTSSGVVSQEPTYIGYPQALPGYPNTGVMYGRVTVLNGNESMVHSKKVYEFETPNSSHYSLVSSEVVPKNTLVSHASNSYQSFRSYLTMYENRLEDRTSKIGSIIAVKDYKPDGSLFSATQFNYTSALANNGVNQNQGVYSNGALMFDLIGRTNSSINSYVKVNRTTVLEYPWVVETVNKSMDGFTSVSKSLSWDFKTGFVDEQLETSSMGLSVKSVTRFAYKYYPELGPRSEDATKRNMLSQVAATYQYRTDPSGNPTGLLGAHIQEWKKSWNNYQYLNGTQYVNSPEEAISVSNRVWRKGATYTWKGNYSSRQTDGSHSLNGFAEHAFLTSPGIMWQYGGEHTMFDHYSMPLESKDWKDVYAATKMGYSQKVAIAKASNARYNEIAFSSAEDVLGSTGFFGGEVAVKSVGGDAQVVRTSAHSGVSALSLSTGYGFIFKTQALDNTRTYRVSAWANNTNGRVYYKLSNGTYVPSGAPTQTGNSGWHKLTMDVPIGSTITEVGVTSASGTVLFDDFRFQPADAAMVCYVYLPDDYEFPALQSSNTWVLDNDNLYTRYETTESGLISRVYAESHTYGEKLITETKTDYRRFYINQ